MGYKVECAEVIAAGWWVFGELELTPGLLNEAGTPRELKFSESGRKLANVTGAGSGRVGGSRGLRAEGTVMK